MNSTTTQYRPTYQSSMPNYQFSQQPIQQYPTQTNKGKDRLQEDTIDAAAFEREFEAHATDIADAHHDGIDAHGLDSTQEQLDAVNDGAASMYKNYKDMAEGYEHSNDVVQEGPYDFDFDSFINTSKDQSQRDFNATGQEALNNQQAETDRQAFRDYQEQMHKLEAQNQERLAQARVEREEYERMSDHMVHSETEQPIEREQPPTQDDDALAATAGELLERVSDNTSDKFKKSSFLAFMEQIRDRQIKVEGDKFVDVNGDGGTATAVNTSTQAAQPPTSNTTPPDQYMAGALAPGESVADVAQPRKSAGEHPFLYWREHLRLPLFP